MRAQRLMIVGVDRRARRQPRVRAGRPRRLAVADGAGRCAAHVVGAHRRQDLGRGAVEARLRAAVDSRSSTTSRAACTVSDQGVTASGVTLFVPMSLVAGSSNNVYGIDNDIGYVVWQRQFDAALPAPTAGCPGGITRGATRIVRLDGRSRASAGSAAGAGGRLSQPARRARARRAGRRAGRRPGRSVVIPAARARRARCRRRRSRCCCRCTARAAARSRGTRRPAGRSDSWSPRREEGAAAAFGFLSRPPASAT